MICKIFGVVILIILLGLLAGPWIYMTFFVKDEDKNAGWGE